MAAVADNHKNQGGLYNFYFGKNGNAAAIK